MIEIEYKGDAFPGFSTACLFFPVKVGSISCVNCDHCHKNEKNQNVVYCSYDEVPQKLYKLKLLETMKLNSTEYVEKVPGGFNFIYMGEGNRTVQFVPDSTELADFEDVLCEVFRYLGIDRGYEDITYPEIVYEHNR